MSVSQHDLYCRELAGLIASSESPDASPDDVDRIERHLRECPICQGAESALTSAISRFRSADVTGVRPEFEEDVLNRLCKEERPDSSDQD